MIMKSDSDISARERGHDKAAFKALHENLELTAAAAVAGGPMNTGG